MSQREGRRININQKSIGDFFMKGKMKKAIASAVILLAIWVSLGGSAFAQAVGSDAPDFSAEDTQGQKVSLSDLKGKVVLLDFWASWCAPCKQEMPFLIELYKTYKEKGFEVIAVNLDTQEKNMTRFIEQMSASPEFKITFKVVSDPKAQIAGKYKLEGMPSTFLIDRQGHIRYRYTGFHPSKKEDYKSDLEQLF